MILIEEKPSNKLPNITSLYLTIPFINLDLDTKLKQQPNSYYDKKTGKYEFAITKLFYLVSLLIKYDNIDFKPYKETKKDLVSCNDFNFSIKPYSYQLEGIEYGLNHNGWLLLDDQGLGKTFQMIYLAEVLKKKENLKHCLIICGVNGLKYNWANEISKFSNLSYVVLGQKVTKTGKIRTSSVAERCKQLKQGLSEFFVITNIETLQSKDFIDAFNKSKSKFDMIVLDEAHRCKNPSSKSAKNLLKLKSKRNIALTGTIIMNNPEDAYLPLKWTGNLNCTYSNFKGMYNIYGGFGGVQVIGHKNLDLLQEHIASCSLRRLKSDVLDLPDKTYLVDYVEMGTKQKALYKEISDGILAELDLLPNKNMSIIQELTLNMRARQVTAWPGILTSQDIPSAKLDRLDDLVEDIVSQGDKIVVFCTFKAAIPEIARRLAKFNPLICTGDQSDIEINLNKKKFETVDINKVLVCTWQKMGTGHTLTAANYVIFVDTPWTDADFQQCCDRIYRIGQNKKCFIITLVTKDTYDERVLEIVERKEAIGSYLLDNKITDKLSFISDIQSIS